MKNQKYFVSQGVGISKCARAWIPPSKLCSRRVACSRGRSRASSRQSEANKSIPLSKLSSRRVARSRGTAAAIRTRSLAPPCTRSP